jgi:adenylate cyclase class 2
MNKEIEIQVQVEKPEKLLDFLKKQAVLKYKSNQKDEYFIPSHRNFLKKKPIEEWFRIRESAGKTSVTYKKWHYLESGKSTHCDEYETSIGDGDQFYKILKALDFKSVVTVDKTRKAYSYLDYEIAIDSVKGLGDFIEIESKAKNDNEPEKVTAKMIKFLKDQQLGKINRNYRGYSYSLLFPEDTCVEEL